MGYRVFNNQTQKYEGAQAEDLAGLLSSGQYKLAADEKIRVTAPDGQVFEAGPTANLAAMAQDGFTFETYQAKKEREAIKKAKESPGLAFGTAALRGATMGLSDVGFATIDKFVPGVSEEVAALKQANPIASGLGEVTGAVGSTILAPAGGIVGQVGKLGAKTSLEAGKVLGADLGQRLVLDSAGSAFKQMLQRAGTRAAGNAVEGALYGAGQTISEAALGDPGEAAQNLIGNVGLGAILGGGLGAAGGAFKDLTRAKIGAVASKAVNEGIESAASVNATMRGLDDTKLKNLFSNFGDKESNEMRQKVVSYMANPDEAKTTFTDGMQKLFNASNDISYGLTGKTNEKLISTFGKAQGKAAKQAALAAADSLAIQQQSIRSILSDPIEKELYNTGFVRKMESINTKFRRDLTSVMKDPSKSVGDVFESVLKYRREIDKFGERFFGKNKNMLVGVEANTKEWFDTFRGEAADVLSNTSAFGPLAAENKEINRAVSQFLKAQKFFMKKFGEKSIDESGREIMVISPSKMGSFLNDQGATRNAIKKQYFDRYTKTMDDLIKFSQSKGYLGEVSGDTMDLLKNIESQRSTLDNIRTSLKAMNMIQSYTGKSLGGMLLGGVFGTIFGGPEGAATGAAAGWALNNPVTLFRVLTKAESAIMNNKNKMAEAANSFFSGLPIKPRAEARPFRAGALSALSQLISGQMQDEKEKYVRASSGSTEGLMARLMDMDVNSALEDQKKEMRVFFEATPMLAAQMVDTSGRALQFLQSKIPAINQTGMFDKSKKVNFNPSTVSKFERYAEAAMHPTETLELINKGALSAEHVEAIQAVYPALYEQARQAALLASQIYQKDIGFEKKLMLGRLFNVPTVPGLNPQNLMLNKQAYIYQPEKQGGTLSTQPASQAQTATQQVTTRT